MKFPTSYLMKLIRRLPPGMQDWETLEEWQLRHRILNPTTQAQEERWEREFKEDLDEWIDEDEQICDDHYDEVEDWELLGLDPDTPEEEIAKMWEDQM